MMIKPGDVFPDEFPKGAVLVDKPFSWTSFDVVNKVRYALGNRLQNKKLKVGDTPEPSTPLPPVCW